MAKSSTPVKLRSKLKMAPLEQGNHYWTLEIMILLGSIFIFIRCEGSCLWEIANDSEIEGLYTILSKYWSESARNGTLETFGLLCFFFTPEMGKWAACGRRC